MVVHWFKILSMGIMLVLMVCFKFLSKYIMYVLIDCIFWADRISLYKLDLTYLCIIIKNYNYIYFMVLCLLLSTDKFYIHFGGSVEY